MNKVFTDYPIDAFEKGYRFLTNDFPDILATYDDYMGSFGDAYKLLKNVITIPDKIFIKKIEKYSKGIFDIPEEDRKKYVDRIGKERFNQNFSLVMTILDKTEEHEKISIYVHLFKAKLYEKITEKDYRRMMFLVEKTMKSDIEYLLNLHPNDCFNAAVSEIEGLIASGWLIKNNQYVNDSVLSVPETYKFTIIACTFFEVMHSLQL